MKKILMLLVVFICLSTVDVMAQDVEEYVNDIDSEELYMPRYVEITSIDAVLSVDNFGKALIIASTRGSTNVSKIVLSVELMQYKNGRWNSLRYWKTTNNLSIASFVKEYFLESGYDYKLYVTAKVYDSRDKLIDSTTESSKIVSY